MATRMTAAEYLALQAEAPKRTKFRNVRRAATAIDAGSEYTSPIHGRRVYDSKAEAKHAAELDRDVSAGWIKSWIPQVSFPLPHGAGRMQLDFMVIDKDGTLRLEDVKGPPPTRAWLNKRKLFENAYGIPIGIIRGRRR